MPQEMKRQNLFTYEPTRALCDPINVRIIEELQGNPRISMTELGRRIGMSTPAVSERVRRLEESDIIRGYRLEINPAALGLPITVYIRVRPNPGQLPRIADLAQSIPEVVESHRITGEDCFILKAHIPALEQLDRLLDQVLVYGTTTTSLVQSTPVALRALPLPDSELDKQ